MNEPMPYPNDNNHEDRMTKKDLKEINVTTYIYQQGATTFLLTQSYKLYN